MRTKNKEGSITEEKKKTTKYVRCKTLPTKSVTFVNKCTQDVAKCDKFVPSVFCKIAKLHSWVLLNPAMPPPTTTIYHLNMYNLINTTYSYLSSTNIEFINSNSVP